MLTVATKQAKNKADLQNHEWAPLQGTKVALARTSAAARQWRLQLLLEARNSHQDFFHQTQSSFTYQWLRASISGTLQEDKPESHVAGLLVALVVNLDLRGRIPQLSAAHLHKTDLAPKFRRTPCN